MSECNVCGAEGRPHVLWWSSRRSDDPVCHCGRSAVPGACKREHPSKGSLCEDTGPRGTCDTKPRPGRGRAPWGHVCECGHLASDHRWDSTAGRARRGFQWGRGYEMTLRDEDESLGEFLAGIEAAVEHGSPSDRCLVCGSTSRLLHPVGRAWACSSCHAPDSYGVRE